MWNSLSSSSFFRCKPVKWSTSIRWKTSNIGNIWGRRIIARESDRCLCARFQDVFSFFCNFLHEYLCFIHESHSKICPRKDIDRRHYLVKRSFLVASHWKWSPSIREMKDKQRRRQQHLMSKTVIFYRTFACPMFVCTFSSCLCLFLPRYRYY